MTECALHPYRMGRRPRDTGTTPMKAIRAHCLWCSHGSRHELALCPAESCASWPFRAGRRPAAKEAAKTMKRHGMGGYLAIFALAGALGGCGVAQYTTPDGRGVFLTGYDLAETSWGDGIYQITLSESNPYDRVSRRIEDTEFGNTYSEDRSIDPAAPARVGLWRDLAAGLLGFLGGLMAAPAVAP